MSRLLQLFVVALLLSGKCMAHDGEHDDVVDQSLMMQEGDSMELHDDGVDATDMVDGPRHLRAKCKLTVAQTEGPYFTANSPSKSVFTNDKTKLDTYQVIEVSGKVLDKKCKPVANSLVDFWHADPEGVYDNVGYIFRGHQFTDAEGNYKLVTYFPGEYPGRTEHIHVKIHVPSDANPAASAILTSQLYFPKQKSNKSDGIFSSKLVVKEAQPVDNVRKMSYNFVINA